MPNSENLTNSWILYEAGVLSKTIDDKTRLCANLLYGLRFQDVEAPLGMFQATKPEREDTLAMLRTINRAVSPAPVPDANLAKLFDALWPQLEEKLKTIPETEGMAATERSVEEVAADLLELARSEADSRRSLEEKVTNIESILENQFGIFRHIGSPPTFANQNRIFYGDPYQPARLSDLARAESPFMPSKPSSPETNKKNK